ncbi:MAG: adenylate/guanylate cyclase domain-containing protein [Acidimicrobiia bacterium]
MSEHSRQEVAHKAGVDLAYVDRLVDLGMLRPADGDVFSSGDVRRARWIHNFEQAGVPLEGVASAVRKGTLSFAYLDVSAFDWFAGLTSTTFEELSDRRGIPFELLAVVREAFGYAEPRPEDYVREDELAVMAAVELQISFGFRPVVIESLLRVYADSLRRLVEAETHWYRTEVELPLLESGMTEREMMTAQAEIGSRLVPRFEQALVAMYHGQQERTWTKSAVEDVEGALEKAGLYSRLNHPPAVSFLDLTGYTRLTEEEGDEAAADLAAELRALVRRSSLEHGGESVKWLGDGVMFYFPDPSQGLMAALEMVEGVAAQGLPPARVGIHAGPVIFQEGDYFGRTVNIAARMADYARPGEVLVSQEMVESASAIPVKFDPIGPVHLKGVTDPLPLYTAHRTDSARPGQG